MWILKLQLQSSPLSNGVIASQNIEHETASQISAVKFISLRCSQTETYFHFQNNRLLLSEQLLKNVNLILWSQSSGLCGLNLRLENFPFILYSFYIQSRASQRIRRGLIHDIRCLDFKLLFLPNCCFLISFRLILNKGYTLNVIKVQISFDGK